MVTGIIIQARMTSRRFPGKSMALLAGKPVLQHVIERCKEICGIDEIVVAVPYNNSDEIIYLCGELDIKFHQGSEDNVLERFYSAAIFYNLNTIMRITGDCPLLNPMDCQEVFWRHKDYQQEYTSNGVDCEMFSFSMLERAHLNATDPYDREHVTPWMKRQVANCVDYPEDIERLEKILARSA